MITHVKVNSVYLNSLTGHVPIKEVISLALKAYSILSVDYTTLTNDKFSLQKQSFKSKHQDNRQYPPYVYIQTY